MTVLQWVPTHDTTTGPAPDKVGLPYAIKSVISYSGAGEDRTAWVLVDIFQVAVHVPVRELLAVCQH